MVALGSDQTSKKSRHTAVIIAVSQVVLVYFGSLLPISRRYWSCCIGMPIFGTTARR
jgi:hypothetical protein